MADFATTAVVQSLFTQLPPTFHIHTQSSVDRVFNTLDIILSCVICDPFDEALALIDLMPLAAEPQRLIQMSRGARNTLLFGRAQLASDARCTASMSVRQARLFAADDIGELAAEISADPCM